MGKRFQRGQITDFTNEIFEIFESADLTLELNYYQTKGGQQKKSIAKRDG